MPVLLCTARHPNKSTSLYKRELNWSMQKPHLERPPKRSSLAALSPLRLPWLVACCRSRASCSMPLCHIIGTCQNVCSAAVRSCMVMGLGVGHHSQACVLLGWLLKHMQSTPCQHRHQPSAGAAQFWLSQWRCTELANRWHAGVPA